MFSFQSKGRARDAACLALFALIGALGHSAWAGELLSEETALDRYVAKADPSYSWKLVATFPGDGFTGYVIDLKSQTWRTEAEVNRTLWEHWLMVAVPKESVSDTALLFIGGGSNKDKDVPTGIDDKISKMAVETKSVIAELKMVPNQPLIFAGEKSGRTEDAIIAYSWDKYMKTGDEEWPLRLPMVKSAVRAMDATQAFLESSEGGGHKVPKFMVSGGSKRGWTTWCTAAVDKRVVAISPMVIDVLNVDVSMQHHHDAYGFWAPAIGDYTRQNIHDTKGSEAHDKLMKIEDPYSYRARFTMPKFIVNATGDEYFLPDSSQFYFNDLPGEKHLRYAPNTKHSLAGSDVRESLTAFFQSVVSGKERPKYTWTKEADGTLKVKTTDKPKEVKLWQATNPVARDFRLMKIGPAYTSSILEDQGDGVYIGKVPNPPAGWTAFFVELTFDSGFANPYKFTTEVSVVPDTFPGREAAPAVGSK